jgi:hypothetical protein
MMKHALLLTFAICICISVVSAESDYCDPFPNNITTSIVHEGNWFNITFTTPTCFICVDNGAGYGDVDCTPCPTTTFSSNVTCGIGTFGVAFTENSGLDNATTEYYWDFGDGNTSTDQNPITVYSTPGVYDVDFMTNNTITGIQWDNKSGYMRARAIGDTCTVSTTKKYSTQMSEDPSMIYIVAFGAFVVFIVLLAMGMRRR